MELGSALTVSDPFGLSVSEYPTVSSVSRSRSSNRTCGFPASGFPIRFQCDPLGRTFESHSDGAGCTTRYIEANASLRTLVHRNTEEAYWEYVKELAEKEGVDPQDEAAVRRFDKNRPGRKTSNEEWKNPHDPQAKVGRTKDGACDMIYKPEHVSDLESGAIVQAEVLEGDHADTKALSERVASAVEVVNRIVANQENGVVRSLTADKGYFAVEEIAQIQEFDIRTVIGDANAARRRKEALAAPLRKTLHRAACAVKSQSGKALLRKRGMHLERSFEHVLDEGGMRRATLQGKENLTKRHKIAAACFNLGVRTPKHGWQGL